MNIIKLCRFAAPHAHARVGAILDSGAVADLTAAGATTLADILNGPDPLDRALWLLKRAPSNSIRADGARFLAPVDRQEVWAAGVTYLRSKKARMEESDFSATAYDRVYEAPRPEIFFKSLAEKVVGPAGNVGIREDARWNVPEPELALVFNPSRQLTGFTIGNDMSSRDIEGENLLYLPQAKTYRKSCALGPVVVLGASESEVRTWTIGVQISRSGSVVFRGETSIGQIKRTFAELSDYLHRSQEFPNGAVLLTGTGVVPGDDFTLAAGDTISIQVSGIGTLTNTVEVV